MLNDNLETCLDIGNEAMYTSYIAIFLFYNDELTRIRALYLIFFNTLVNTLQFSCMGYTENILREYIKIERNHYFEIDLIVVKIYFVNLTFHRLKQRTSVLISS